MHKMLILYATTQGLLFPMCLSTTIALGPTYKLMISIPYVPKIRSKEYLK